MTNRSSVLARAVLIFALLTSCVLQQKETAASKVTDVAMRPLVLDYSPFRLGRVFYTNLFLDIPDPEANQRVKQRNPEILVGLSVTVQIDPMTDLLVLARKYSLGRDVQGVRAQIDAARSRSPSQATFDLKDILSNFIRENVNTFPLSGQRSRNCHEAAVCALFDNSDPLPAFSEYDLRVFATKFGMRPVRLPETIQSGDLISYFNLEGKLIHSVLFVSDEMDDNDLVFSKNGQSQNLPYVLQTRSWIEDQIYFKGRGDFQRTVLRRLSAADVPVDLLSGQRTMTDFIYDLRRNGRMMPP